MHPLLLLKHMNIKCEPLLPIEQHGILSHKSPGLVSDLLSSKDTSSYQEEKLLFEIISNFHESYNITGSILAWRNKSVSYLPAVGSLI